MVNAQHFFLSVDLVSKLVFLKLEGASKSLKDFEYGLLGTTCRVSDFSRINGQFYKVSAWLGYSSQLLKHYSGYCCEAILQKVFYNN